MQFFLDDDGRLYLTWNIGAPIMGAELDPERPNQLISEPLVVLDFDPSQEWMHFGDNKQGPLGLGRLRRLRPMAPLLDRLQSQGARNLRPRAHP